MFGDSRPLTSGSDWLICAIVSLLGHFFCVQSIPWPRSFRAEPSPMAIEWVTLPENQNPENTEVQSKALPVALGNIPLKLNAPTTLTNNPSPQRWLEPSRPGAARPEPADAQLPPHIRPTEIPQTTPQTRPSTIVPSPDPFPTAQPPQNPADLPAESEGLRVSLSNPLIPPPEQDTPPPPIPSIGASPIPRPTTGMVGSDLPVGEQIGTQVNVAANPNPLQFRAIVTVQPSSRPPEDPAYTPPQPRYADLILTADPLVRHCTVPTLEAVQTSGTPLPFEVTIDATGHLTQAIPQAKGVYTDYQAWATCILQDWLFYPAQRQQTPIEGNLAVSITLQVLPP